LSAALPLPLLRLRCVLLLMPQGVLLLVVLLSPNVLAYSVSSSDGSSS
jgi:hypothetical protein